MDTQLDPSQKVILQVMETDVGGKLIPFVGRPQWVSSAPSVATVLPAPDGLSATVLAVGLGSTNITVTADGLTGVWNVVVAGPTIMFIAMPAMPK
jgi:hypothetical protein